MPVYFFQMADSETPKVDQVVGEEDDDDPAIIITWAADDVIMNAMALPERPNSLGAACKQALPNLLGANPAACKQALVAWLDTIIRKYVHRVDVCDYDNLERKVDGSYSPFVEESLQSCILAVGVDPCSMWRSRTTFLHFVRSAEVAFFKINPSRHMYGQLLPPPPPPPPPPNRQ